MKDHQKHMTKAEKRANDLKTKQGDGLRVLFPKAADHTGYALYVRVRVLEDEAHKLAEDQCNRPLPEGYVDRREASILKRLDAILGFKELRIPIFCNGDPRGHGLKIHDEWMRQKWPTSSPERPPIHTDWGGYGILAPDYDEEEE